MNNKIVAILLLLCFSLFVEAQVVNMGGGIDNKFKDKMYLHQEITKENVRLLTIGIGSFDDPNFDNLSSISSLNKFKKVSDNYLRLSYRHHPSPTILNKSNVKTNEVREALADLVKTASQSDVIIISIISHGEVKNGEYYLVCSNTDSRDYGSTAVSGTEIRSFLEQMANKGALVLVFLDTCHAAALFENSTFSPTSNGSIVFYASSLSNQAAKEIFQQCRFTEAVMSIFLNENKHSFNENGYVTVKSIDAQIKAALGAITEENKQQPYYRIFSNNENLGDYPIIKEKEYKEAPSIWAKPYPFSPIAVSPRKGKALDYCLIGLEGASLVGMVLSGPILQSYYNKKIKEETNVFARNDYREKGKNAAVGFCISTGLLISSYVFRTIHVRKQFIQDHRERQFATIDLSPIVSTEYNGLALVLNF